MTFLAISTLPELESYLEDCKVELVNYGKDYSREPRDVSITVRIHEQSPDTAKMYSNITIRLRDSSYSYYIDSGSSTTGYVDFSRDAESSNTDVIKTLGGVQKTVFGNKDGKLVSLDDIVSKCDVSQIYNNSKNGALALLDSNFICASRMFQSGNIYPLEMKVFTAEFGSMQGRPVTLFVSYAPMRGKYLFGYNPEFILQSALSLYLKSPKRYKGSLQNCYLYTLALLISHEMMHLLTGNTSSIEMSNVNKGSHKAGNIIEDSFINCKLRQIFKFCDIVETDDNQEAPFLDNGVTETMRFRTEVGKGLSRELLDKGAFEKELLEILSHGGIKYEKLVFSSDEFFTKEDVGKDSLIEIEVSPTSAKLRESSMRLQRVVEELMNLFSDGRYFSMDEDLDLQEINNSLGVLPVGTLVTKLRNTYDNSIYIVSGYDPATQKYTINTTEMTSVDKKLQADGSLLCRATYKDSGKSDGKSYERYELVVVKQEDLEWTENSPKNQNKDNDDNGQGSSGNVQKQTKNINVGDIVYVRSKQKFAKVTSIGNGTFSLEEVEEENPVKLEG